MNQSGHCLLEPMPTWLEFYQQSVAFLQQHSKTRNNQNFHFSHHFFTFNDFIVIFGLTTIWIIIRLVSISIVKNSTRIKPVYKAKVSFYSSNVLFHTFLSMFAFLLMIRPNGCFELLTPSLIVNDFLSGHVHNERGFYWFIMLEESFYVFGLLVCFTIDKSRNYSYVMTFHHLVAMVLIATLYTTRVNLVHGFLLHDVCDIFMSLSKLLIYLQKSEVGYHKFSSLMTNCCKFLFFFFWMFGRCYIFPLRTLCLVLQCPPDHPIFNIAYYGFILGLVIFALNIYWAVCIILYIFVNDTDKCKDLSPTSASVVKKSKAA